MREAELQSKITKQLESAGWLVVKVIQCNKNGWPDLQFCETECQSSSK